MSWPGPPNDVALVPLLVRLRGRCLVAGGGAVALRKARTLLAMGLEVQVVSLQFLPELKDLAQQSKRIYLSQFPADDVDPSSYALVVAATDDSRVNHDLAGRARADGVPVNVADSPDDSDVLFPAVCRRGDLTVAVSTGASPALAMRVRDEIDDFLPERLGEIAEALARVRSHLQQAEQDAGVRRQVLRVLASHDTQERLLNRPAETWDEFLQAEAERLRKTARSDG